MADIATSTQVINILLTANTLTIIGLAFGAGRYAQRLDTAEKELKELKAEKGEVNLAVVEEKVDTLSRAVGELKQQFRELALSLTVRNNQHVGQVAGD